MASVNTAATSPLPRAALRRSQEITIRLTPFDQQEYRKLIETRGDTIRRVVKRLKPALGLATALDAEDRGIMQLGRFHFVLCFGLLYHLENPLLAIRNLRGLTEKCLLLESMCLPEERVSILLREEPRQGDQSLTEMACYPSESSLVKMLYRAGFAAVYRVIPLPDHDDFRETPEHTRRRTVLLASALPLDVAGFRLLSEPHERDDPWAKRPAAPARFRAPHGDARDASRGD